MMLWTVISVVILALIAAGSVAVALHLDKSDELPPGIPPQPAAISVNPQIKAVSANAPEPTATGLSRAIATSARNPALGQFTGQISDALTGATLWTDSPAEPRVPASNAKILTASAALLALPHDQRLTTTVVAGPNGQIILKGAGDPTLSAQPRGADTFYTDAPRIADLAAQIRKAGIPVSSVAVDTSAYTGPTMERTWDRRDIAGGDITPIESLIADGGRIEPLDEYSPRVEDPAISAGTALAGALGVSGPGRVTEATASAGGQVVAKVTSAPLVTRVNDMMRYSDNVLAETLSIELSVARGGPASIAGGVSAVEGALAEHGFDMTAVTLSDASGLSYANRVPAAVLDKLMAAASGPSQPLMRSMLDGLPVAGGTGTLADRFDPTTNPGAGWVRAKTGTLTGVSSLTGIVQTIDGRVLSFALMSGGTSPADARPALDDVAGDLRECGCR
ncbi:D-alanyl-D-alanine carboxypeptidase/D-alanyl-D-alanine-endopeptidase [Gordonia sp. ABSL11-1]|uniref:D-alanyl-D-alanine carboxypeptidase/D-alanyl-D-alanine endopeptidase n=1 Tax=Gordonia sp. ABSL11-1 TaxID=3053924 RepID=UPI0025725C75|nr:D-alanyl-D-alanine carboxypeptidase/D-alanyl-D-alanine-endopeptidase [Gordonia sp. ABSL11-1]MDL9945293.1 D-alanyl-D-alanine carboxypeptidase/D-alanyl-D-alanine-endopeptidase [Gordonia sp. ABSL11-1]